MESKNINNIYKEINKISLFFTAGTILNDKLK